MFFSPYELVPLKVDDGVFVNKVKTMTAISHQIETIILNNHLPVTLFVGFQRFSNFLAQAARYQQLARICRHICVWGIPDVTPPSQPGLEFYPLDEDMELTREWFMIAESAQFFTALLTQESTYGLDVPPDQRRFTGIWTYNPQLVQESALITARMIGLPYQPPVQRDYARQSSFLAQIFANLMARRDEDTNRQVLLQHRDALLRSGLTSSETPMLLLDGQKHVLAASQSACQLLGAQNEVPVNQPLANVADGIFARHDPTSIEAPQVGLISTLDGRMLATHSRTLYNADGEEIGWVVSLHDAAPVPLSDQ